MLIVVPVVVVVVVTTLVIGLLVWMHRRRTRGIPKEIHYEPPVSYTAMVPPITERRVVPSEKSGLGSQYTPVPLQSPGAVASGSGGGSARTGDTSSSPDESTRPPSYFESMRTNP